MQPENTEQPDNNAAVDAADEPEETPYGHMSVTELFETESAWKSAWCNLDEARTLFAVLGLSEIADALEPIEKKASMLLSQFQEQWMYEE